MKEVKGVSERKKVRKQIVEALKLQIGAQETGSHCYEITPYWRGRLADQILDISELAIVDRKAQIPLMEDAPETYRRLLLEGWVKEVKDGQD